jgi:hypothetical protein
VPTLLSSPSRTTLARTLAVGAAVVALGSLSACGSNDVTKGRLEASLSPTFANLYVQRAAILGERGVTVASTHPRASCDRGGPKVADVGPGADWICMVTFTDDKGKPQDGKFELQARSNSCFTAGGPTKLLGPVMITDQAGTDVPNPPFEFDACFDPSS